jgi:hypothetical protein
MRVALVLAVVASPGLSTAQGRIDELTTALDGGKLERAREIARTMPEGNWQCANGLVDARAGQIARAWARLHECERAALALRERAGRTRKAVRKKLEVGKYAPISLAMEPSGAAIQISLWPETMVTGVKTLWLPYGTHKLRATLDGYEQAEAKVKVEDRARQTVVLQLTKKSRSQVDPEGEIVDFSDESAAEAPTAGALKKVEHKSLLPDRYAKRRGIAATREKRVLSPWDVRLTSTLGPSSWADGDDSVIGYRVMGGVARRFGVLGAEAGLGLSRTGGKLAGQSELSTYVGFELLGRARLSSAGWGGSIAAGGFVRLPFADEVLGRDLSGAVVGVAGEVTFARRLGESTWLELVARTDLSGNEAADGLGRAGLVSAGLALLWSLPSREKLAPLPTDQ